MSNWVTLPNGVHIDLDDPNNPLTGDGTFESYLGGGKGGDKSGPTLLRLSGTVSEKFIRNKAEKYGLKVEVMRAGNEMRVSVPGGSKLNDLINDFDEDGVLMEYPKTNSKADPTMSGKDSKSFDRDLELAFKEFGTDEDAILDALRSTGKDYGMSNGDLQSVVEAYVLRKGSSKSNDGPSTFAMAKEMGMKASDLFGLTEKEIRERYRVFKKGK